MAERTPSTLVELGLLVPSEGVLSATPGEWPGESSLGPLSQRVHPGKPSLKSGSWNELSVFLDKEGEQHGRNCFRLAFQELLGFPWQHLDQGLGAHPPLVPEARLLAAKTEISRPAAFLPGLTSVQNGCEAAK